VAFSKYLPKLEEAERWGRSGRRMLKFRDWEWDGYAYPAASLTGIMLLKTPPEACGIAGLGMVGAVYGEEWLTSEASLVVR